MSISPSRKAAFDVLHRVSTQDAYAVDLLHSSLLDKLSIPDRALATEITMGVLRWQKTLEGILQPHIKQSFSRLDLEVQTALLMGAYQLLFLDRVPASAAVNESVELVKRSGKRSATGLVNAVLRKLPEDRAGRQQENSLDPVAAHPAWLVECWKANYGEAAAAAICAFNQQKPVTAIRCADRKVTDSKIEDELRSAGITLEPGRICTHAWRVVSGDVTATAAFRQGRVAIQDEASQLIALLVEGGSRILDCCAAPGGKTRLIAERNPNAKIVAAELHEHRLRLMQERVHAPNIEFLHIDARKLDLHGEFDRVLADMPCSGTGTLARNPEIKWRLKPEDLADLAGRQREILRAALECVAPGGSLIYSTCSLEPEENEHVINALKSDPRFEIEGCGALLEKLETDGELFEGVGERLVTGEFLRTVPGIHDCDGFFAVVIRRRT